MAFGINATLDVFKFSRRSSALELHAWKTIKHSRNLGGMDLGVWTVSAIMMAESSSVLFFIQKRDRLLTQPTGRLAGASFDQTQIL